MFLLERRRKQVIMSRIIRLLGLLVTSMFLLTGCVNNASSGEQPEDPPAVDPENPPIDPEDPPVDPEDPPIDPEDPPVDPEDPPIEPEPKKYEKDEEGFYILEEDYFSYIEDETDKKTKNEVMIPQNVEGVEKYSQLRMYIGDKQVPVYNVKTNISHTWTAEAASRQNNSYATIGLKGRVEIKLQSNFAYLDDVTIRPTDRNVPLTIDSNRRVLSFTISDIGQYTIEMRSGRTLHLFVEDIDIMNNSDSSVMYFAPGIHNKSNDSRIGNNNTINLNSNQKVYIAPGAFIYAKFLANNASNIEISGPGYIDGSIFERDANKGSVLVPIEFNNCTNITLKDFGCIDPAGWCFNMYFCKRVTIDNVKVISSRSNGDGISIQSCQNVNVTNSFLRTWDDSLVVKNYPSWSNRDIEGTTRSIHFSNCLIWTDLAQSMEIGYECVGQVMEDISFDNITILHNYHKAVISIHNGNNADIKNVKFTNITIEDASMGKGDGNNIIVDIRNIFSTTWSTNHKITSLGSVDEVLISNVLAISGSENPEVLVQGTLEHRSGYPNVGHYVSNVTINDFYLYDKVITKENCNYRTNQYTNNIEFTSSGNQVTGATYTPKDISEYGNNIIFR